MLCQWEAMNYLLYRCTHREQPCSWGGVLLGALGPPWVRLAGGLQRQKESSSLSQPGSSPLSHSGDQILPHHQHCEMECVIKLNLDIKKGLRNCYNR